MKPLFFRYHNGLFLAAVVALWMSLACPTPGRAQNAAPLVTAAAKKPNVLFIVSDDLNMDLGVYGHKQVKTPNLERLAKRGVRFDKAYCQYPLCNPSRSSFLSGLRPETIGVLDNATPPRTYRPLTVFLPQAFRNAGYFVANSGKTFHYEYDDKPSWDISESGKGKSLEDLNGLLRWGNRPLPPSIVRGKAQKGQDIFWGKLNLTDEQMGDGISARRVAGWMEQATRDKKPFFLAAGIRKPHMPLTVPSKYFDLYPLDKISYPIEPPAHVALLPPLARKNATTIADLPDKERREAIQAHYAAISFMDAQVGVMLDQMDKLKLWDNTVVVFLSDHGFETGEHGGLWQKMVLFEESARVPLLVVTPGIKGGQTVPGLVELIDVYPTLMELCGLPVSPELEGKSVVPLLSKPNLPWKKAVYVVVERRNPLVLGHSVHTERFRYTEWDTNAKGGVELYDHQTDPYEYKNLALLPGNAPLLANMKELMQKYLSSLPKTTFAPLPKRVGPPPKED